MPRRQHDAPKIPDLHSLGTRTRAGEDVPAAGGGRQLHHEKPAVVERRGQLSGTNRRAVMLVDAAALQTLR